MKICIEQQQQYNATICVGWFNSRVGALPVVRLATFRRHMELSIVVSLQGRTVAFPRQASHYRTYISPDGRSLMTDDAAILCSTRWLQIFNRFCSNVTGAAVEEARGSSEHRNLTKTFINAASTFSSHERYISPGVNIGFVVELCDDDMCWSLFIKYSNTSKFPWWQLGNQHPRKGS